MKYGFTLKQISEYIGATLCGDAELIVTGVSSLDDSKQGTLTFLSTGKHRKFLLNTQATAVLITEEEKENNPVASIICENPYLAFAKVTELFAPNKDEPQIHTSSVVEKSANIGSNVSIGANSYIGENVSIADNVEIGSGVNVGSGVKIGSDTRINANVSIYYDVSIGSQCIIHSGAVIGSDGFGFANDNGKWIKIHQLGSVRIGDNVEIGANTTIDRGAINDTIIEDGVKLDNLIQIAHNVKIGKDSALAGCVGIAGSAELGERVAVGGAVTILGHLTIHNDVMVTAHSLVTNSIKEPGVFSSGTPLQPKKEWQKNYIRFKQLDQMSKRIKTLEDQLKK